MFGFSLASQIFQGSTQRTWNCVTHFANLIWGKFSHLKQAGMPRSRKRHHSRSRSRSRSLSRDRSHEKPKKNDSNEKDGKRRKIDSVDSPQQKRSLSSDNHHSSNEKAQRIQDVSEQDITIDTVKTTKDIKSTEVPEEVDKKKENYYPKNEKSSKDKEDHDDLDSESDDVKLEKMPTSDTEEATALSDSDSAISDAKDVKIEKLTTPRKPLTPKQIQKRLESEKKKQQKQKEREDRERQKQDEKDKLKEEKLRLKQQKEAERQKQVEEKQKQLEQKQKEKEMKEEQRKKEKEEKEQKRKEKEEKEEQKRKEKEMEKLKKQQEIEEKNKEKQKEQEKKQKTVAAFVSFFKKPEGEREEKKFEKPNSNFMPFEVKSDMRLPPIVRRPVSNENLEKLDEFIQNPDENASYLKDLRSGAVKVGKSAETWPYEDPEDEVTIIEEDKKLGETICEDESKTHKIRAKFLSFHENRRPPYFGTWRKKSKCVKPRRPFGEDTETFNYEEDSDDDWEEEEQGESLDHSDEEGEKEADDDKDDYEVDNEFFVPHGHLSDDEIDDEENARLSPDSLKQKLKLLKDEFEEDIKSKTAKLKPRSIGCIWYNKQGDNVEDAIKKYLQPFAMIINGQIEIKKRSEIFVAYPDKKKMKTVQELPADHIPLFLKIVHGNVNKKKVLIEQFLTYMANNGLNVEVSKANLTRFLKHAASYSRCKENGPMKNKFGWFVNDEVREKYNINLDLAAKADN